MGTEGFLWKGCEISIGMEGYKRVQKNDDHSSEYSWLAITIKPDTPINVYTRFCLNTAKSKFSLVSTVAD